MPSSETDTIAAIATAPGAGGIGIVRLSGPRAPAIATALFRPASARFNGFEPWKLHRGRLVSRNDDVLDDALAVLMPGPNTFTGEDVAELHCHGGPVLLTTVLEECLAHGARLAERGEFTRRAFCNGRMDLSRAEAVAEMIAAPSREGVRLAAAKMHGILGTRMNALRDELENLRAQVCLAVDFPEEEVECLDRDAFLEALNGIVAALDALLAGFERTRCWREGILVALAGPVNAGKSSLMNALLGRERAIVTPIAGTTRDFLEENVFLAGLPARLVDTAGLRSTEDLAEAHGIRLGREQIAAADVVLLLIDGAATDAFPEPDFLRLLDECDPERTLLVWNKADLALPPPAWTQVHAAGHCVISASTGQGLETLAATVRHLALSRTHGREPEPGEAVPNLRQAQSLTRARDEVRALIRDVDNAVPYDLCAVRLESAASLMGDVIGLDAPEDVLNRIFESFCIGK